MNLGTRDPGPRSSLPHRNVKRFPDTQSLGFLLSGNKARPASLTCHRAEAMTPGTGTPRTPRGTEQMPVQAGRPAKCHREPFQAFGQGDGMAGLTLQEDLCRKHSSSLITLPDGLEPGEMY